MTYLVLLIVAGGMGAWGYWRGGTRVVYRLLPLLLASALVWIFTGLLFRVDFIVSAGLAWPLVLPMVIGLAGGYIAQFFLRKQLPKEPKQYDRIAGATVCVLMSVVMVWLFSLLIGLRHASANGGLTASDTSAARTLNNTIVRWIPGVGSGSDSLMNVVEIASVDPEVRSRAAENLKIDHLSGSESFLKMWDDAATHDDIEAASRGNIIALWRLQKNPLVYEFYQSEEMQDAMKRLTLHDIAKAVEDAKKSP